MPVLLRSFDDIEHMLCWENRSFDHYFGTLSAVDGFLRRRCFNKGLEPETGAGPTGITFTQSIPGV